MPSPTRKERPRRGPRQPARATAATGPLGRPAWAAVALVALVVLAYVPVYRAGFVWDDDQYVTDNLPLRTWPGLRQLWFEPGAVPQFYPLVYTTFWIEYHLWGLAPLGYHVVNVLLHAVNAVLVWRVLSRLGVPGAWLAAAIFAVHPVHVESVAWVTERKNVLSLAFALSSILCYLRFAPWMTGDDAVPSAGARRDHFWALALFAAALLSKTAVVTLPAVLLVLCWWKQGTIARRDIVPLVPFFVLAVAMGLVTVWVESQHVKAGGPQWDHSPVERLLIAGRALWFYAGKLVWPYPVMFHYPRWTIDVHQWWQYAFPAAAVLAIMGLWVARRRIGRGPLAAVLIFAGVLVPVLGFFNVYYMRYSFVADHFQYHASLGLLALVAAGAAMVAARLRAGRPVAYAAVATVVGVLLALTAQQASVYRNLETLLRDTIAKNREGWTAYANLSAHLDAQGRLDEAHELAQTALRLNPGEALVQHNVGHILLSKSERSGFPPAELDESMGYFREAARLDPKCVEAYRGLGFALLQAKRPDEARQQFAQALEIRPGDAIALFGMGSLAGTSGNLEEAEQWLRRALAARPNYAKAHHALGVILSAERRDAEAIEHLQTAVELDPAVAQAYYDLAGAWAQQGQLRLAAQEYAEALQRRPAHYDTWCKLGQALEQLGDTDQAVAAYREALRLKPDAAEAQANLRRALGQPRRDNPTP